MDILQALSDLIGQPPAGYDVIVWLVCALVLLFLLKCAFGIIASLLNWVGGRR